MKNCSMADCDRPSVAKGLCKMHHRRLCRTGSPFPKPRDLEAALIQRFWRHVDKRGPDDCWLWTGAVNNKGYGQIRVGGKTVLAHRVSFAITNGSIADDIQVLHHCDTPKCQNPVHLFSGDPAINSADKVKKGRQAKGETCHAKLTNEAVMEIRAATGSQREIAERFNLCQSTVSRIRNQKRWRHVQSNPLEDEEGVA